MVTYEEQDNKLIKHLINMDNVSHYPEWLKFFLIFTRFEYALKRSGYVFSQRTGDKGYAEADWKKYCKDVEDDFEKCKCKHLDLAEAVKYLEENPPKRQVLKDGKLEWAPMNHDGRDYESLIYAVKQVRNNLFHGDKQISSPKDPSRDSELMKNSTIVLEHLLNSSKEVKEKYCEPLE